MVILASRKKTKYASFNAPKEESPGLFSKLDNVVTVENCHYYLSLMEQFMNYKQNFSTSLLRTMLARAEVRYARWRDFLSKSSVTKVSQDMTPPIDVAYIWHVHMLSPFRYYEDALRLSQQHIFHVDLPLFTIHQGSINTSELNTSALKWKQFFGSDEPYMITPYNVATGTTEILCCFCKSSIQCSWIEYTNWRYNPITTVSCPQCHCETSASISSVAKLISDIDRDHIAGMMLNNNGKYESEQAWSRNRTLANCITDIETSQLGGQRLIHIFQSSTQIVSIIKAYRHGLEPSHSNRQAATDFEKAISLCYFNNPSLFSIDLIQAINRQQEFNTKAVKEIDWQGGHGIARGILHYHKFLQLFITHPGETMVPTLEVDLAWHTHMLHPSSYLAFTQSYVGRMINHNDNIEPKKLKEYSKRTNEAWITANGYPLMNNYNNGSNSNKPELTSTFNNGHQVFSHMANHDYIPATFPEKNTGYLRNDRTSTSPASNHHDKTSPGLTGFRTTWKILAKVGTIAVGTLVIICNEARRSRPRSRRRRGGGGSGCGGDGGGGCGGGGCGGCGG